MTTQISSRYRSDDQIEQTHPRTSEVFSCYNIGNTPLHTPGSYVVGATIIRDDIDELYEQYPGLELIADIGSELETLEGSAYETLVFEGFQNALKYFKDTLKNNVQI